MKKESWPYESLKEGNIYALTGDLKSKCPSWLTYKIVMIMSIDYLESRPRYKVYIVYEGGKSGVHPYLWSRDNFNHLELISEAR